MEIEWGSPEAQERLTGSDFWQSLQLCFAEFIAPPPQATALDVECGDGRLALLWSGVAASVVGVDTSSAQLKRAEKRRLETGSERVTFRIAAPEMLPFEDGTFDLVSAFSALAASPEPARCLTEIARVLRPGGIFGGVVTTVRMTPERIDEYVRSTHQDAQVAQLLNRFYAARPGGYAERPLERLLTLCGLRSVRTVEHADGLLLIVKGWK